MNLMMEYASPQIYYSLACFAYIIIGVMGAVVRWCHMCRPYDEQGEYFYPARRQVSFFYAAVVMQLPYVFCPMDTDVWFYIRAFGIIYYPTCFAMVYQRYFRLGKMNRNWRSRLYFIVPFVLLFAMLFLVLFGAGDVFDAHDRVWLGCAAGLGMLLSLRFVQEGWWLKKKITEYHNQNFSNESDFPYAFAGKVIYAPVVWFVLLWGVFFSGSHWFKFVVDIIFAVWMIKFLCMVLHPNKLLKILPQEESQTGIEMDSMRLEEEQNTASMLQMDMAARMKQINEELVSDDVLAVAHVPIVDEAQIVNEIPVASGGGDNDNTPSGKGASVSEEDWESVKREVLTIVGKRYLEPHLKRLDVIRDVSMMRHTLAGNFITQIGFYKLVNAFRIRHYEKLVDGGAASKLNQDAIAELCGFKNRWGLSNAKKRLADFDYSLIEDFV